jgi:hypothetical protein
VVASQLSDALVAIFERICAVVPDLPDDTRRQMVDVAYEGLRRLENTPLDALDEGLIGESRRGERP